MEWLYLSVAIASEVAATLSLKMASWGRRRFAGMAVIGYLTAFTALSCALSEGMPLGMAYGVWAASGIVLTALAARLLFAESLTLRMGMGMILIVGGVLVVELGG